MKLTVSRWHKTKKHIAIQDVLRPKSVVPAGSIGVKMGLVAMGAVDCYLHPSTKTAEWDTSAPDVILREAGGAVTDFFGAPLLYNKAVGCSSLDQSKFKNFLDLMGNLQIMF
jgi:3'-phosphoadenosine 5'-phosphosulfate (PAPS) 3'-phosphatase